MGTVYMVVNCISLGHGFDLVPVPNRSFSFKTLGDLRTMKQHEPGKCSNHNEAPDVERSANSLIEALGTLRCLRSLS